MQNSFKSLDHNIGLYAVVPDFSWLKKVCDLGVKTIQLRIKNLDNVEEVRAQILASVKYVAGESVQLFINDYWQLAIDYAAYGVHLGQEDLLSADLERIRQTGLRLGISTHNDGEFSKAKSLRPSYLACGAVYPTTTKVMKSDPLGLEQLRYFVGLAEEIPVVAIGGIFLDNAAQILACGVSGIAVVRAITESKQVESDVRALLALCHDKQGSAHE